MPLPPLQATLSDGQKLAALKRLRAVYADELAGLEVEILEILTNLAEADFLAQYLGDQPEVVALRARKAEVETKEKRRQYLGKLIERLDQCIPEQPAVTVPAPNAPGAAKSSLRRY